MSQSFNADAFQGSFDVLFINPQMAIPHFAVQSIAEISPQKLFDQGVRVVIFDKDNTITAPYINSIYPTLCSVIEEFRNVFGTNLHILSNSAGTNDDPDFRDADAIEQNLSISVIRHQRKKPEGSEDVKKFLNCKDNEVVMIGDRLLTDTLFGNRSGFLTIHTGILTLKGDNIPAAIARFLENQLLKVWKLRGITPPSHPLDTITLL